MTTTSLTYGATSDSRHCVLHNNLGICSHLPVFACVCCHKPRTVWEVCVCVCVLVAQLCLTVCDPMDCSLPGFSVHGVLQTRILEWVSIPFSKGSSWSGSHALLANSLPSEPQRKPSVWGTRSWEMKGKSFPIQVSAETWLWYLLSLGHLVSECETINFCCSKPPSWWLYYSYSSPRKLISPLLQSMGLQRIRHNWGTEQKQHI